MKQSFDLGSSSAGDRGGPHGGSVLSIGVFDGVHRGHQAILGANVSLARERGLDSAVLTFRRHPKRLVLGKAPRTLTSLEHRLSLFQLAGVDHAIALSFDEDLRGMEAEDFIRDVCIERLGARAFVLGFDSRFGKDRRGTPELLESLGHEVHIAPRIEYEQRAISSTAIRECVELGDLEGAATMLGRPVGLMGTVVRGDRLGRRLGFPTANLDPHHELHPPVGVYATRVREVPRGGGPLGPAHPAVTNIGFRPTLQSPEEPELRIETHLLDVPDGLDLYGHTIQVEFEAMLRREQRFPDLEALRAQIAIDVARASETLRSIDESTPGAQESRSLG